jgi:hypothetical protein
MFLMDHDIYIDIQMCVYFYNEKNNNKLDAHNNMKTRPIYFRQTGARHTYRRKEKIV